MPTRPRTGTPARTSLVLNGVGFVQEVSRRQRELLEQMVESVRAGKLRIESDGETDCYIEAVIRNWSQQQHPSLDEHMALLGAVFAWALLDVIDPPTDADEPDDQSRGVSRGELALEALRTAAAIWGKR